MAVSGEADPYTLVQVAAGQTAGGVITGVDYGHGLVSGLGALGTGRTLAYAAVPAAYSGVAPLSAYSTYPSTNSGYLSAYSAYPYHAYGKREAEAEPWTVDQIAQGAHIAEAIKDGHPHNVGVITNANIVPAVAAYSGYPYAGAVRGAYSAYPYSSLGVAGVHSGVYAAAPHAVAATPFGLTHSSNVGVCTNYLGVQVPC